MSFVSSLNCSFLQEAIDNHKFSYKDEDINDFISLYLKDIRKHEMSEDKDTLFKGKILNTETIL